MLKKELATVEVNKTVDVICDFCSKSTMDSHGMNYEYAHLTACWGYASRKDMECHDLHICEDCYDAKIVPHIINPSYKTEYL